MLVGGGLANGLIALRLKAMRPDLRVLMVERDKVVGGQHTWCHFASDVAPDVAATLEPLIVHRWSGYSVHFPAHRRDLTTDYLAITSERLHEAVTAALGKDVRLGGGVRTIRQFLDADLVDTMHVAVAPLELGSGQRLWESPEELLDRFHLEVVPSPSGVVHHLFWRR